MALVLSERTKNALSRELVEPNLVLIIDGIDKKYSVRITKKVLKYDIPNASYDDPELFYDGLIKDEKSDDLLSISGTSNTISQQLEPDKGSSSSTQSLTLRLIDRNEEITQIITPGEVIEDILYRNARVYFGLVDTAFEDYQEILNGKIMTVNPSTSSIDLVVTHPEDMKRSSIFIQASTELNQVCHFASASFQQLSFYARPDVSGSVSIQYTSAALGDDAVVSVVGNDITVQVDTAFTKAKTVKKKLENHEDANQLITVSITGNGNQIVTTQSQTFLVSDTNIYVNNIDDFLLPVSPLFKTYVRIGDEIIEYTSIDTNNKILQGCTRQSLTSFGSTHAIGAQVTSLYKLGDGTSNYGNAIDLALKVLLSGSDLYYFENILCTSVNLIPGVGTIQDALWIPNERLFSDYGITEGDLVTTTGSGLGNNFIDQPVFDVIENVEGTYLIFNSLSLSTELNATISIKSKSRYNVLPDGAAMLPRQVDITQFNLIKTRFSTAIANYEFYLKDTVNTKDFVNTQLLLPSALYSIPRKGKISAGITAPPLYAAETPTLNLENTKNPKGLKLSRSVNSNFYNTVTYLYNPDSVEDRFLSKNIRISADSINRIDANLKQFKIESDGLRPGSETTSLITRNGSRFLDRYKFGAENIKVETLFKTGYPIEVGDSVLFGDPLFNLSDTTNASRDFSSRIMEVTNKEWNWQNGKIVLTLLDTTYSNSVLYGVFSPSSLIGTGSTTSNIIIKKSFGTGEFDKEKDKWQNYIGKEIKVHSEDWSVSENTYIVGFSGGNDNLMIVDPPLSFSPLEDYLIDIVRYEEIDTLDNFYSLAHCYWCPSVNVVSGASNTSFDVSGADISKFFIGSIIRVHKLDFTIDSGEILKKVTDITGNTITCQDLGFVPDNTMVVDLIGFSFNNGKPYAWL